MKSFCENQNSTAETAVDVDLSLAQVCARDILPNFEKAFRSGIFFYDAFFTRAGNSRLSFRSESDRARKTGVSLENKLFRLR